MSDKRYPTRMHEVLGVETGQVFYFETTSGLYQEYVLDTKGHLFRNHKTQRIESPRTMADIINHPERITRRPRLTEEQVAMLKAAWALGARYIAREGNSRLRLSDNAPIVLMGGRLKITDDSLTMYIESYSNPLVELVKQSGPAPLDIVQVLRQNGVEVEP